MTIIIVAALETLASITSLDKVEDRGTQVGPGEVVTNGGFSARGTRMIKHGFVIPGNNGFTQRRRDKDLSINVNDKIKLSKGAVLSTMEMQRREFSLLALLQKVKCNGADNIFWWLVLVGRDES